MKHHSHPEQLTAGMMIAGVVVPDTLDTPRSGDFHRRLAAIRRDSTSYAREADLLVRGLGPPQQKPVLEIGPGIGIYLFELYFRKYPVMALDTVRENVDHLRKLSRYWAPGLEVTHGDVARLPYADNTFAGVYAIHVWEHVYDQQAAIRETARVLVPSGRLVIIDGNFLNPLHWKEFFIDRALRRRDPLAGFRWLANKHKVVESFGMGWKGKDEDLKSVWWWRRALATEPRLRSMVITTTTNYRRMIRGRWSLGPLAPFAGRLLVIAEKRSEATTS